MQKNYGRVMLQLCEVTYPMDAKTSNIMAGSANLRTEVHMGVKETHDGFRM